MRGLNDKNKRKLIKQEIQKESPQLVCLQETKWSSDNSFHIKETMGSKLSQFQTLKAIGTAGGVIIAWDESCFEMIDTKVGRYCLTIDFHLKLDSTVFRYTGVYGPSTNRGKGQFFREIREAKPEIDMPWMVAGDFNATLVMQDRSNTTYPMQHMLRFRALISNLNLMDLPLQGRNFTWSSEREHPTYVRLDRFLISPEWATSYPNTQQRAIIATMFDHCPLICTSLTKFPTSNVFRVENSWLKVQQFKKIVQSTWLTDPTAQDVHQLHQKLKKLTKEITKWSREYKKTTNYQQKICVVCLTWLTAQAEARALTQIEKLLQLHLKQRHNQIALQMEDKWYQRAKRNWVKKGDKNTHYLYQLASVRKRNNWVGSIEEDQITVTEHKDKAKVFFHHFIKLIGTSHNPTMQFDYGALYD